MDTFLRNLYIVVTHRVIHGFKTEEPLSGY